MANGNFQDKLFQAGLVLTGRPELLIAQKQNEIIRQQEARIAQLEAKRKARQILFENSDKLDPSLAKTQFDRLNSEISALGGEVIPFPAGRDFKSRIDDILRRGNITDLTSADFENSASGLEKARELLIERQNRGFIAGSNDSPGAQAPIFSGDEQESQDVQQAMQLFQQASRAAQVGDTAQSNNLLSRARFILDNSAEVRRNKELDKPISRQLASELGVPVGTMLREVQDAFVRSPEETVAATTEARETTKGRIKAVEQIAFMDQASDVITDLIEDIKIDPTIVGAGGSLRSIGKTGIEVLSDLGGEKLIETAKEIAFSENIPAEEIEGLFNNPRLSVLNVLENTIGLILARTRQPAGRLTVDVIKRSIEDVRLTGLTGSQQVQDRLNFILELMNARKSKMQSRFGIKGEFEGFSIVNED